MRSRARPDGGRRARFFPYEPLYASAKTGDGVGELFRSIGEAIWRRGFERA